MRLAGLHETHPGVTEALGGAYCEAAAVCLSVFHAPPTSLQVEIGDGKATYMLEWEAPDQRQRNAYAEMGDATRDGAYATAFLCLEASTEYVVVARAEVGTGSDWYVAPPGHGIDALGLPDLDDPHVQRFEVSGTLSGDLRQRMREKIEQLRSGDSPLPGLAAVVGFEHRRILIERA